MTKQNLYGTYFLLLTILGPQVFVVLVVSAYVFLLIRVFDVAVSDTLVLAIPTLLICVIVAGRASFNLVKRRQRTPSNMTRTIIPRFLAVLAMALIVVGEVVMIVWLNTTGPKLLPSSALALLVLVTSLGLVRVSRSLTIDPED